MKIRTPPINPKLIATIPVLLSAGIATGTIYFYGWWGMYLSPLILGILAGGLADLDSGFTGRLKNILFSMITFALSSVAVQITFDEPVFLVSTFTALAFIFTMFGAAGNRYRTISFATLVVAVYTALSQSNHLLWYVNTGLMLMGALLHSLSSLVVHIVFPHRPVQESMAQAFSVLANYLDNKADFFDPDEVDFLEAKQLELVMNDSKVVTAFTACQNALFYRMRGQHRHPRTTKMLRYYFAAQDIHERISSSHVHYHAFAEQMKHSDLIFRIQRLLRLQAQACREFSGSLKNNDDYEYSAKLKRATLGAEASLQYYANAPQQASDIAPYRVQRLLDNIMHVSRQFSCLGANHDDDEYAKIRILKARLWSPEMGGLKGAWQRLHRHTTLASPVFRHAVRMAISVCICCVLVYIVPQIRTDFLPLPTRDESIHLGYWILLTAIYVCQPNYSATKKRLIQRIFGTIAGVLVGSALILLKLSLEVKLVLIVVMLSLFFLFRTNKHSFSTLFITIQAILSFSIAGYDVNQFFVPRVVDTMVGAVISGAAVYFLWPDWKYVALDKTGNAAIQSNAGYLNAVLDELHQYNQIDSLEYRQARRNAQDSAAALSSMLSDMSGDVQKFGLRLKDGFLLLKINYSLISYISALGSFRNKMRRDDDETIFLMPFFTVGNQLVELMKNMVIYSQEDFQAALFALHNELENIRPVVLEQHNILAGENDNSAQNQVLWQQLMMISELLQPCYHALQRINSPESYAETLTK